MHYVTLGNTGITISRMGLGCSKFGSALGGISGPATQRLISTAIGNGINFFDTANIYGQGESERLLGKALHSHRHNVVIATKAGQRFPSAATAISFIKKPISHLAMRFPALAQEIKRRRDRPLPRCFEPHYLENELERSLKRLGTDYVDIFYLHSPQPEHLKNNAIEKLMKSLKSAGKIRSWGVSCDVNDDINSIIQSSSPDVLQMPFLNSLEPEALSRCQEIKNRGGSVITRGVVSQLRDGADEECDLPFKLNAAWGKVLQSPHITAALCGTTKVAHLLDNVAAVERLDEYDLASAAP